MRGIIICFLLILSGSGVRADQDLCERLTIPPEIGLSCAAPATDSSPAHGVVVIRPDAGPFASLSQMTLQHLEFDTDSAAWFASETWLKDQLTLDFGAISHALDTFVDDPDNPLSDLGYDTIVGALDQTLDDIGSLPLSGCGPIIETELGISKIRCEWGIDPMTLYTEIQLIPVDEKRYAINIVSMNKKRMRHFMAIANSFIHGPI